MIPRTILVLCAASLLLGSPARAQIQGSAAQCDTLVGGYNTTVLMVADPGSFTGSAEAEYYIANLENPTFVPTGNTVCVERAYGTIMGQNVTVVSSGIGPQNSALCTFELLQCASHIKDFIFSGTSGFSAQVGGILNPPECMEGAPPSAITRIGDVCVTPWSNNWDCRLASWTQQCTGFPNQCSSPALADNFTVAGLFGPCDFDSYDAAGVELADEIVTAIQADPSSYNQLGASSGIQSYQQLYWEDMSNGTGEDYTAVFNSLGLPTVYNYKECVETDGQFFWSGAPWDYSARTYVASTINSALNTSVTPDEVIAVSAEEAVGVSAMFAKFAAIPGNPDIPYTFVRANSDYTHLPLETDGYGNWVEQTNVPEVNFETGYAYAIASYSIVVLNWLKARCMAAGNPAACAMAPGVQFASS